MILNVKSGNESRNTTIYSDNGGSRGHGKVSDFYRTRDSITEPGVKLQMAVSTGLRHYNAFSSLLERDPLSVHFIVVPTREREERGGEGGRGIYAALGK